MKKTLFLISVSIAVLSCNIKKEEKGELPDIDVDVSADAGKLPEYEVNWADVNVGTTTKTVEIPKVVIVMEEEQVEVPFIDVDMPDSEKKEERTLMVEAEVTDNEHKINIKEIWASGNRLFVISELTKMQQAIGDKKMRISDQVTLNAPDLEVKHYIIGDKPDRVFNTQHTYIRNMETLKDKVGDYKVIYSK
ncbi:hypothetical protein [Ulvibacterium sp.]|uniref:hypothetical protein n=1 Tax=Ulvibacterium sp. TaxID=2665914 RepID=UPI003BAACDB6